MSDVKIKVMLIIILQMLFFRITAQISPGALSRAHSYMEGLSNCTKCHVLGQKETSSKCLECHKEIQNLIRSDKGYHASSDVKGKECHVCHGEHFGLDFKIIRFDENTFNHDLAGYKLEAKHNRIACAGCHNPQLIATNISQKKENTYLGLDTQCISCHEDVHQNTLSSNCNSCHNQESFIPASGFNHAKTNFPLIGRHQTVNCNKCHQTKILNDKSYLQFTVVKYESCINCHVDVHKNKFGSNCRKCHNENSFKEIKSLSSFDHNQTNYPLQGMHQVVDCKKCHTGNYTKPLKHNQCNDCHSDYHEGQLIKNNLSPDCSECHTVTAFSPGSYGIERHNQSDFVLEGAHLATPCIACHKQYDKWSFDITGTRCIDCHNNVHQNNLSEKYLEDNNCKNCHDVSAWNEISYNHAITNFPLQGKHADVACRDCHYRELNGITEHYFSDIGGRCENCHSDVHFKQFDVNETNGCERCHTFNNWQPDKFNHDNSRFKIDGKHIGLECTKCHQPADSLVNGYIIYHFEDISCASCH